MIDEKIIAHLQKAQSELQQAQYLMKDATHRSLMSSLYIQIENLMMLLRMTR